MIDQLLLLLRLFFEFAKVGLFSVGGGLATIPFLQRLGESSGWFTNEQLTTMVAVGESTPGPIGVNMATYVGYETAGVPGAVIATLGLITPSILVIIIIAGFLRKFRNSKTVSAIFYGLRPASTALIVSAGLSVAISIFVISGNVTFNTFTLNWAAIALAAAVFVAMKFTPLKKLHPIAFIAISAVVGILLKM